MDSNLGGSFPTRVIRSRYVEEKQLLNALLVNEV